MDDRRLDLVKVGGSLFEWPGLPRRLMAFLRASEVNRLVLVAGGGGFADVVRALDRIHGLGDDRSHGLALRAMELASHALSALVPELRIVESVAGLDAAWSMGAVPILCPRLILDEGERAGQTPLPRSWEVTSDSIAARLASTLAADELVLLKSVEPAPGLDRIGASAVGLVDPRFPIEARSIATVSVVNLRASQPSRIALR